jgi:hypothetical protein
MKKIHADDGAAFAKEATSGTNPDLKAFAAETYPHTYPRESIITNTSRRTP